MTVFDVLVLNHKANDRMTEKRASQLGPLSASITDLQAYHAENDTASKGMLRT